MKSILLGFLFSAAAFASTSSTNAQSLSLGAHTVAGGSASSSGGSFTLRGTAGQYEATPPSLTGGGFSLQGGFWSVIAMQTPGLPMLAIQRQPGIVYVTWPRSANEFVLEESSSVTGTWAPVNLPRVTTETTIGVNVPLTVGHRFFRLRKP